MRVRDGGVTQELPLLKKMQSHKRSTEVKMHGIGLKSSGSGVTFSTRQSLFRANIENINQL